MAKRLDDDDELDTYSRLRLSGGRQAVWEPYADGGVWVLTRGEDFPESLSLDSLRFSAYGWARYRKRRVSVHRLSADQVSVFFGPEESESGPESA